MEIRSSIYLLDEWVPSSHQRLNGFLRIVHLGTVLRMTDHLG